MNLQTAPILGTPNASIVGQPLLHEQPVTIFVNGILNSRSEARASGKALRKAVGLRNVVVFHYESKVLQAILNVLRHTRRLSVSCENVYLGLTRLLERSGDPFPVFNRVMTHVINNMGTIRISGAKSHAFTDYLKSTYCKPVGVAAAQLKLLSGMYRLKMDLGFVNR